MNFRLQSQPPMISTGERMYKFRLRSIGPYLCAYSQAMKRMRSVHAIIVLVVTMLSACAIEVPADPEGTLNNVTGAVLRVGATENAPWVDVPDGTPGDVVPTGSEAALVESFAQSLGAEISWLTGSEATLVGALERGEIDMVIGGFDAQTLWSKKAAVTVPYLESPGPDGPIKHVMLVRMGENRFLVTLERFLLDQGAS